MQAPTKAKSTPGAPSTDVPLSPEQLGTLARITSPLWWVIIAVLVMIGTAITLWSIFGHIYVSVSGLGMVLPAQGHLTTVRANASGTVTTIAVSDQAQVKTGDLLVKVTEPQLQADLNAARATLALLQKQQHALSERETATTDQQFALERNLLDARHNVAALERSLSHAQYITTPIDGLVAFIVTAPGKSVVAGEPVAVIEPAFDKVLVVAYFQIADAKRISIGVKANVNISSIDSDIYGTAVGTVTYVADLASTPQELQNTFDNSILVSEFEDETPLIKATIELSQAPEMPKHVLMSSGRPSPTKVSIGTTVTAQVIVEQEPPISYVIKLFN